MLQPREVIREGIVCVSMVNASDQPLQGTGGYVYI